MVNVDDIRREIANRMFDNLTKYLFISIDLSWRKCSKDRAGIGHDIAHAWNTVIQHTLIEVDKTIELRLDAIKLRHPAAGDSSYKKILMTGNRRLSDNILQVKSAAGTFRMLPNEMENLHW